MSILFVFFDFYDICTLLKNGQMYILEIIGALIGLVYIFLEYKANFWLWPVGILMSLFYVVIFFNGKFYADAAVNLYYIGANVYGLTVWLRHRFRQKGVVEDLLSISKCPRKIIAVCLFVSVLLWVLIYVVLHFFTDSVVPVGDAFTTALSIVAMWLLAHKYIEQWLFWIVVEVVSVSLYIWKGLYPTAILYGVYTVVAVLGYFNWRKEMTTTDSSKND